MSHVSVIMGSESDLEAVGETFLLLKEFKCEFEARVLSAHRTPKELAEYVQSAPGRGVKVFIAAAGASAALAGVIAAHTTLPVIGIPLLTKSVGGLDSLLSTVQMPAGIPVACVALGKAGARNAALLALQILALNDSALSEGLKAYRRDMAKKIVDTKINT